MARQKRRCRNCPDEPTPTQVKAKQAATQVTNGVIDGKVITTKGEGARLWNHVLFGTSTCLGMIQGYADLGMPGDPLPQIQEFILKLTKLKTQLEKQKNADRNST